MFVSTNADAPAAAVDFTRIHDDATTPGWFVSGIAVDPSDANHAFVSYAGYGAYTPDARGQVYEVRFDPGTKQATWSDLSANVGDQPVTGVARNAETGDLYAGTDFGVLRRASGSFPPGRRPRRACHTSRSTA